MSDKPQEDLLESIISRSMPPEDPEGGDASPPSAPDSGKTVSKANKRTSVYRYLLVLFGAAFILLLLAYFIQQRSSETAMSDLRDSMNLSRAELMEEIDGLRAEKEALEEAVASLSPLPDELAALREEYARLEGRLQSADDLLTDYQHRDWIFTSFAILEQALRDRNYEVAAKYVRILVQEDLNLGIMSLDGTAHFDAEGRLAEVISLLEKRGALEPGEVSVPGGAEPEQQR